MSTLARINAFIAVALLLVQAPVVAVFCGDGYVNTGFMSLGCRPCEAGMWCFMVMEGLNPVLSITYRYKRDKWQLYTV